MKPSIYSLDLNDWQKLFSQMEQSPNTLSFWLRSLFKKTEILENNISKQLLANLQSNFNFDLPTITHILRSDDGTIKFQVLLHDGNEVETVLIPFEKRYTICLSTQVGCAMKCSFCYTGTQGLKRNLEASEIVGQYLAAKKYLIDKKISLTPPRIVFMGQGEPLQNMEQLTKAIEILTNKYLVGLGPKEITLSTVGFIPGIKKLKDLPRINLALSLHSPFNEEREKLIPLNQKYPLEEVFFHLDELTGMSKRLITYEYILIKNLNMTQDHADELEKLLSKRKAVINLIPFNPFPGGQWERPDLSDINEFKEKLVQKKLRVFVRTTKGDDILAACGQLKINKLATVRKNHE